MRLIAFSIFLLPSVLALEPISTTSPSSNDPSHTVVLMLQKPAPLPQTPYLELRHLDLDRRQVQPAAVQPAAVQPVAAGAPAQAAAGAAAPVAPVANPVPAAPAPAAGVVGAGGTVVVNQGPATALSTAPSAKTGVIGMGTLTGKVGVVKTQEAKSAAGLAVDNRYGFVASWPATFKVGASVLLGTAVGVGILL